MRSKITKTKDYMQDVKQDKYLAYSAFLHQFKTLTNEERQEAIGYAPDNSEQSMVDAAKLAATVECLAKQYKLTIPEWVYEERFILPKPYYGGALFKEYRKFLRETSLPEFARRNLFLGDNVMNIG